MKQRLMSKASVEGLELEYETRGAGEPVVLIHPGNFADWFSLLLEEPALTERYYVIRYHRAGCVGSSRIAGPVSLSDHGSHCRSLIQHLGIERAHVVGHSSSGNVALEMALDFPDAVHSLAVMEPALMNVPSAGSSRGFVTTAIEHYQAGDVAGAVDIFRNGVCGPGYRLVLDRQLPGAFEQHVGDAQMFFTQELPNRQQWKFTRDDARRITQTVLAVLGAKTREAGRIWEDRQELLLTWLPNVEPFILPDATHLLEVENPGGLAEGLAAFFARHPL